MFHIILFIIDSAAAPVKLRIRFFHKDFRNAYTKQTPPSQTLCRASHTASGQRPRRTDRAQTLCAWLGYPWYGMGGFP